ncbi:glycosyltransferase [Edwardsiella tarda]|uniref:glycosyltransferase n=1 Tax=Edwardsiella tarda TaxID=636 RepID=UPI00266F84AB|nr:glycosyltransferase [Edwardsiella tarda]WKS80194.1 glycosyltransferase [Edwardsiella tarda]
MGRIAVALSVCRNDTVEYLQQSIDSILNQTYNNFDLYIKVDGVVSSDIYGLLDKYKSNDNVFIDAHSANKGLTYRLNQIIDLVLISGKYKYLARMDADDISDVNRFDEQVCFLSNNKVDVVGSDVVEIDSCGREIFYKHMDSDFFVIKKKIIKKCPFNHPSVMFKMDVFNDGYRYNSNLMNTQDYYLWVDLIAGGKIFSNINKPLLKFRVDDKFHSRRGFNKAVNDIKARIYALNKLNAFSFVNIFYIVGILFLRLSPKIIKKLSYKYLR